MLFDPAKVKAAQLGASALEAANDAYARLQTTVVDKIPQTGPTLGHTLKKFVLAYFQAHTRRALMFAEASRDELLANRGLVAFSCSRAIVETTAVVDDFCKQITPMLVSNETEKALAFVNSKAFATRIEELAKQSTEYDFNATNVVTLVKKLEKELPFVATTYDALSEATHPNAMGAIVYFQSHLTDGTIHFSDKQDRHDFHADSVIIGAWFLVILERDIKAVTSLLDAAIADGPK